MSHFMTSVGVFRFTKTSKQAKKKKENIFHLFRVSTLIKLIIFHLIFVYGNNYSQLFELLALCGMLMDYNWTEILKRKELIRKSFAGFDPNIVAKMDENEIMDIVSDKAISLAECRVRCIVDNAKCILKIVREFGSFSSYMWGHMNHKPTINKFRYPRNVPLRSPKAEAMSRELLRRGFRFVGPVIVYSFMQAAGLTIDHLVDCFRYKECVALAERPWRHM
ncbi:Probable GMP synthase [glutamine-hydrolyzing] [Linum grandiflorum]